jgi:hypothetical protein
MHEHVIDYRELMAMKLAEMARDQVVECVVEHLRLHQGYRA